MINVYEINAKSWNSVRYLLSNRDCVTIIDSAPNAVKDFFVKRGFTILGKEDIDERYQLVRFYRGIPREEYVKYTNEDLNNWSNAYLEDVCYVELNPDNAIKVCSYIILKNKHSLYGTVYKGLLYTLLKSAILTPENLEIINTLCIHDDVELVERDFEKFNGYKNGALGLVSEMLDVEYVNDKNTALVHVVSEGKNIEPFYRRSYLNKKLREQEINLYTNAIGICDTLIVSHPSYLMPVANVVYYDRTDNWFDSIYKDEDIATLNIANKIACSSKYLYNQTLSWIKENRPDDAVEVKYIPNGSKVLSHPDKVEKFEKPTLIYIGNNLNKIDLASLVVFASTHPEIDILIYADVNELSTPMPENMHLHNIIPFEELFPILCKCHAGLLCMLKSDYVDGQLSNKVFNYFNAHLPVLYSGIEINNYADYSPAMVDMNTYSKTMQLPEIDAETFDSYTRDWDTVTDELIKFFEL